MDDLTGQHIKGYDLLEPLGTGGFGAVYRAYQTQVEREVAIKIILPMYANHPDFIRRFEVEARVIARLEHPHIIPLYDYWRDADGAYLVMRYLRGGSLRARLKEKPLSLAETSRILDQMAGALAAAHRHGVIHRDIKPDNILLDDDGNPYLTDFGIAKDLESDASVTQADTVVGSPAYLSPEQVRAEPVIPQSDIYSLGIVLYELLTGEHPFSNEKVTALLLRHLNDPLPSITARRDDIPESVEHVIHRATAKNPADRYPDAPTLAAAFRQALAQEAGANITPSLIDRTLLLEEIDIDNPYKGLQAFEEVDTANFFGREALIDRLLIRLREQSRSEHFLAIIGPSGSGKSSVVQAGLIPRMRHGTLPGSSRWFIVEMLPGTRPLEELEAALLRIAVNPPSSLLTQLREDERGLVRATKRILSDNRSEIFLFIDQFEEVFTRAAEPAEVEHFLNSLVVASTDPDCRLRVVITLRADFYDQPLLYPAFGDLVRRHSEVVLPLTPDELERAIVGPADRVGVVLEPGLAQQIIHDVRKEPGALPLVQYALTELFERRSGRVLTLEAYEAIGGALGALARQAEAQYAGLDAHGQALARQLFLRLVTLGEGGIDDTRRRATHSEIMSIDPAMSDVVAAFDRSRLLTFDHDPITREPTIEVAHEALIRRWQRLGLWLEDSREDMRTQRRLAVAAAEWLKAGKDPSYLVSGARLEGFESWQRTTRIDLNQEEAEYLQASIAEREAATMREAERAAREAALEERSRQRLRLLAAVMAVAMVVSLALASIAISANQAAQANALLAEENAARAQHSADEARSLALDANARSLLIEHQPVLALALAIEAYNAYQPPAAEVQQTLARAVYAPNARFRLAGHTGSVLDVATGGDHALSVGADGTMLLWDITSGDLIHDFDLDGAVAHSVALSADGRAAATGLFDGRVLLWDMESRGLIRSFEGHRDVVTDVAFSPDETRILSVSLDRSLRLWDATSGDELLAVETPGALLRVAFSPDGRSAASSSADLTAAPNHPPEERDRTIRVWDLETGQEIQRFEPRSGFVRAIDFSPDGAYILSGTWNAAEEGTLQLWNIASGQLERRIYGAHTDIVSDVRFSADGRRILSASWDRSIRLWDAATGLELRRLEGHQDRVLRVAFTPDESHVLAGVGNIGNNIPVPANDNPADTSLWVWDLLNRAEIHRLNDHRDWVWSVAVSADGRTAATGAGPFNVLAARPDEPDTSVRLWDVTSGALLHTLTGHTDTVHSVAFMPDGARLLSGGWDGTVRLWDVTSGALLSAFEADAGRVYSVMPSSDGGQALAATGEGGILLLALDDDGQMHTLRAYEGHSDLVNRAVFSPDESLIASASRDGTVRLWDAASGQEIRLLEGHTAEVNDVRFSPDGRYLLSASWDGTVRLWDTASGEEVRQMVGHTRPVFGVAFSPDGATALTGSSDMSVRLWDVATGEEIRRFDGHTNWVLDVAYSPAGDYIITAAEDNTARIWQMARTPDDLIEWARANRYITELTCPERAQYRVYPLCDEPGS